MGYPTDVTDQEWAEIAPHLTKVAHTGRPRTVDLRQVFNAIRSKNRTSCQWDMLPEGFPPKSTVFDYSQTWNGDGTWIRINDLLRERVREALGRDKHPHIAVVDSQSVKATEAGGARGYDAGKNIKGRKRHLLVDTNGRVLRVLVHAADSSEREGGIWLLNEYAAALTSLEIVCVDQGYKQMFVDWVSQYLSCTGSHLQVVMRERRRCVL